MLIALNRHHKWQRRECGWECFNLRTQIISCWSVSTTGHAESLGLNACKWVALKNRNASIWCGLVLFRLDETTNKHTYRLLRLCAMTPVETQNTGHDEVISFDLLWNEKLTHIRQEYVFITKLSDWSCRWLSFILKIKPCMSKYELV